MGLASDQSTLLSRRGFFSWTKTSLGGAALASLLVRSGDVLAAVVPGEANDPPPHFGRTPFAQSAAGVLGAGRGHNQYGFSVWMCGAGLKPGLAFGSTDEVGWKAVENRVSWHDFHATVLHLLGIDHERLTFYHNGIQRRLTNVHGDLIDGILA